LPLSNVKFGVKSDLSNVKFTFKKIDATKAPKAKNSLKKAYQYIEIDHENINDNDVESVEFEFKVNLSWISKESLNKKDLALYRFENELWKELETTYQKSDDNYAYYSAKSPGFSYYVIAEKTDEQSNEEPKQQDKEEQPENQE
jgi:PGF-pre-PGF domain-containing protein